MVISYMNYPRYIKVVHSKEDEYIGKTGIIIWEGLGDIITVKFDKLPVKNFSKYEIIELREGEK